MSEIKAMPSSIEAETGVLSCFFHNPRLIDDFMESNGEDSFYHAGNQILFAAFQTLSNTGKPVDLITITKHLMDAGTIEQAGGVGNVSEVYSFVPTPAHFSHYKAILRDKAILRRIVSCCTEGVSRAYDTNDDVNALLDTVEQSIYAIRPKDANEVTSELIKHTLYSTLDVIESKMVGSNTFSGYKTGFQWLDTITGGMRPETWFIGARPSVGKTSMCLQLLVSLAVEQGVPCGFFSLEMSRQRIQLRLLSIISEIPLERLISGRLTQEDKRALTPAVTMLQKSTILIDDRAGLTLAQVRAKARRWSRDYGVKAIFGDYLQRMGNDKSKRNYSEREMHSENVTGITNMGKELDICNIWLAQLNRDCEKRPSGRPIMSDFEGCGRIEQDADLVLLLSRPHDQPQNEEGMQHILFDVCKQRDGDTREKLHVFNRCTTTFSKFPARIEEKAEPEKTTNNRRRH